jgi:hypothetical protein
MNLKVTVPESWNPGDQKAIRKWFRKIGRYQGKQIINQNFKQWN